MKTISRRKDKQFSKPWITRGIKKSIKVKNNLLMNGEKNGYKQYRNSITRLVRISKREYIQTYFENNMTNILNVELECLRAPYSVPCFFYYI